MSHAAARLGPRRAIATDSSDSSPRVVRTTFEADAEPFRRTDGSYRLDNRFRYLIAVVP